MKNIKKFIVIILLLQTYKHQASQDETEFQLLGKAYTTRAGEPFGISLESTNLTSYISVEDRDKSYKFFVDTVHENKEYTALIDLLDAGANPDAKGFKGKNLLEAGIAHNNIEMCRIALEHKAHVNYKNRCKQTPLHLALSRKGKPVKSEILNILFIHGANIKALDSKGKTPEAAMLCMQENKTKIKKRVNKIIKQEIDPEK